MRVLFVKDSLAWPRSSGHDVHGFYMMQALARQGHEIGLLTAVEPAAAAVDGMTFALRRTFADCPDDGTPPVELSRSQERFRSYWGIEPAHIRAVGKTAADFKADAVVVVGLNVLPYLGAVHGRQRIWYAADEWMWHHASQVHLLRPSTWSELKQGAIKGLYERAYRHLVDRVWVVTDRDRQAMRWVAGVRNIDVIPNGVDGTHYRPFDAPQAERTCTFWGRLDFGPNIQALEWFCSRVWPQVRSQAADARFTIYGFNLSPSVRALVGKDGIEAVADLPDLRPEIARHQAVVLPFVSGGGIKNKLLEAASQGKAVICSPHACGGLHLNGEAPLLLARRPVDWVTHLRALWQQPDLRRELGAKARRWVTEQHSWDAAARTAAAGVAQAPTRA